MKKRFPAAASVSDSPETQGYYALRCQLLPLYHERFASFTEECFFGRHRGEAPFSTEIVYTGHDCDMVLANDYRQAWNDYKAWLARRTCEIIVPGDLLSGDFSKADLIPFMVGFFRMEEKEARKYLAHAVKLARNAEKSVDEIIEELEQFA